MIQVEAQGGAEALRSDVGLLETRVLLCPSVSQVALTRVVRVLHPTLGAGVYWLQPPRS